MITENEASMAPSESTILLPLAMTLPAKPSKPPNTTNAKAIEQYQGRFVEADTDKPIMVTLVWYRYRVTSSETLISMAEPEMLIAHHGNTKLMKANMPPIKPK
jgi:hypothetical protein